MGKKTQWILRALKGSRITLKWLSGFCAGTIVLYSLSLGLCALGNCAMVRCVWNKRAMALTLTNCSFGSFASLNAFSLRSDRRMSWISQQTTTTPAITMNQWICLVFCSFLPFVGCFFSAWMSKAKEMSLFCFPRLRLLLFSVYRVEMQLVFLKACA